MDFKETMDAKRKLANSTHTYEVLPKYNTPEYELLGEDYKEIYAELLMSLSHRDTYLSIDEVYADVVKPIFDKYNLNSGVCTNHIWAKHKKVNQSLIKSFFDKKNYDKNVFQINRYVPL